MKIEFVTLPFVIQHIKIELCSAEAQPASNSSKQGPETSACVEIADAVLTALDHNFLKHPIKLQRPIIFDQPQNQSCILHHHSSFKLAAEHFSQRTETMFLRGSNHRTKQKRVC